MARSGVMPFSAKHCITGRSLVQDIHKIYKRERTPEATQTVRNIRRFTETDLRKFRSRPNDMYDDDYYLMGPIPTDLELHEKARTFGIKPPTVQLYARYAKTADGLTGSDSNRYDAIPSNLMRIEHTNAETLLSSTMKSKPMLPRIPIIKHSFQGSIPSVMRSDTTSTTLPECITALSPRMKSSSVDISKLESRLLPPSKLASNSQTTTKSEKRPTTRRDLTTRGLRVIVSPNSRADLKSRPGEYYGRRYPLVILDGKKGNTDASNAASKSSMITTRSLPAISNTSKEATTSEQASARVAKPDTIAVEQAIELSAARIKPVHLNISEWYPELACKTKKLHSKSLDDSKRHILDTTSTMAK